MKFLLPTAFDTRRRILKKFFSPSSSRGSPCFPLFLKASSRRHEKKLLIKFFIRTLHFTRCRTHDVTQARTRVLSHYRAFANRAPTYSRAKSNRGGGGGGEALPCWRWRGRAAGQGMILRSSPLTQDILIGLIGYWRATPFITGLLPSPHDRPAISAPATVCAGPQCLWQAHDLGTSGGS